MFMRKNRAKNGAPQPEKIASQDSGKQRSQKKLAPNPTDYGQGEDWRFTAKWQDSGKTNEEHYQGGVSGSGPYGTSYEDKIPYVGEPPVHKEGGRGLKSR